MSTLEKAIAIAAEAHAGQVDKGGNPYILHPLRVMLAMPGPEARIAAVLHDVVEDTAVTLDDLRAHGFSATVIAAVAAVTKVGPEKDMSAETYEAFVRRAAAHPIGRLVKLADMRDNCDLARIAAPTERDLARIEKYRRAIALLEAMG